MSTAAKRCAGDMTVRACRIKRFIRHAGRSVLRPSQCGDTSFQETVTSNDGPPPYQERPVVAMRTTTGEGGAKRAPSVRHEEAGLGVDAA